MKPTARPDPAPADALARVRIVRRDGRLIPIGPERLDAMRQAILDGTYPIEAAATRGLERAIRAHAKASAGEGSNDGADGGADPA